MRHAPVLALALALGLAAAAPAAAADGEEPREDRPGFSEGYRKGYDDGFERGYRKGLEEGRRAAPADLAPPPPRPTGPITVSSAYYGTSAKSCDATRWVAKRSNGRRSASFEVTNDLCGDPARGERKQLEVTYVCGTIAKTATAYEHRTAYLDCTN